MDAGSRYSTLCGVANWASRGNFCERKTSKSSAQLSTLYIRFTEITELCITMHAMCDPASQRGWPFSKQPEFWNGSAVGNQVVTNIFLNNTYVWHHPCPCDCTGPWFGPVPTNKSGHTTKEAHYHAYLPLTSTAAAPSGPCCSRRLQLLLVPLWGRCHERHWACGRVGQACGAQTRGST